MEPMRLGRTLALLAFAAFVAANLIHNRFGLDLAVIPALLSVGLLLWKPRRGFLIAAVIVIAFPAFAFFRPSAIIEPASTLSLLNHVFLLLAGLLALGAGLSVIRPVREPSHG